MPAGKGSYIRWEADLIHQVLEGKQSLSSAEKKYLIDRYDNEIRQMDRGIGVFLQVLKETGVYDDSLIIVASDHGESFGEHGLMVHSPAVYEELVQVPLIVKYPKKMQKTGHFSSPVSLVDVLPEVLSVLDIPLLQEVPGVPFSQGRKHIIVERYADKSWSWTAHPFGGWLRALYEGDYKYIWASDGMHELYNLNQDPRELNNLIERMPERAREMEEALEKELGPWVPSSENAYPGDTTHEIDAGTKEALKALGYLQ